MSRTSPTLASTIELESPPNTTSPTPTPISHNSNYDPDPNNPPHANRAVVEAVPPPPDGGYGWVVVLASATLAWWFVGITYSWGVFQGVLVQSHLSSSSTLSFVGSLTVACLAIFAIVNARIIRLMGARGTAVLGVGVFGAGQVLSGFTVGDVGGLFITTGMVMGFGASLCFMVVSVAPAQHFTHKRGLANGIVFAGGGLGGAVISFATNSLVQNVGPAWAYRVLGLLTLATGLPAAWLIKERTPIRSTAFIEWQLFRDFRFTTIFLVGAIATFPLFVPPFFLPLYSASLGLSPLIGTGLVAGFNLSSAVGRIGCGFLCDRLGPLNTLFLALSLSASSMLTLWPISSHIAPLIAFVVINGAANGGFFATMPTVVGNVFGLARMSVAMGMIVTGWAGGYLMGAPIAGYVLDAYGGPQAGFEAYRPAIYYAGSMTLASVGLVAFVRLRLETGIFKKV